jgi:hypothetical protein
MIHANNWLEKRVEMIFDENFCLIKCECHCSSSLWQHSQKGQFGQNARISGRIDAFAFVRNALIAGNVFRSGFIHRRKRPRFCHI